MKLLALLFSNHATSNALLRQKFTATMQNVTVPFLDITVNHDACYVFFLLSNNAMLCHKFMCNKTYKSRSNGPIMILTNHFEPLTAM